MMSYSELFQHGDNFPTYVGRGTDTERLAVAKVQTQLAQPQALGRDFLARVQQVDEDFYLLAAGEMWCPDCQLNLTAIAKMCELQPHIKLAVITKGRAEDEIKSRLLLKGIFIPVVIVLNANFEPLGHLVERPSKVVAKADFASIKAAYRAGEFLQDAMEDILALINPKAC